MSEPTPSQVEAIFFDALDLPPNQRLAFVDQKSAGNEVLKAKVMDLLRADAAAGGDAFLESGFLAKGAVATEAPDPASVAQASGGDRFKILAHHRQGGLGEVLIALDQQLGREVAIKQIKPKWQNHREARERFIQEAEVTGRLEHPGVVPVYAMGTWPDGRHFYAMRFVHGETLTDVIAAHHDPASHAGSSLRDLSLRRLLNKFVDVCNTISYAHSQQILHRDIKPSNVMVGPYGETLVVDWGLAKLLDAPLDESMTAEIMDELSHSDGYTPTKMGGKIGTPQYMSPEQASGRWEEIGIRTDIYLLGATLYQILAGRPPHQDESMPQLLSKIVKGQWTPVHEIVADVPPALESICAKAMETESSRRYRKAAEISHDIERWLADEPVSVYRDPIAVRVGRWVRRHRTLAYSGAVAATLLAVGWVVGSTIWTQQRARQLRVERENQAKEQQLVASATRRLDERKTSARGAAVLADKEIKANRYSSALNVLLDEVDSIGDESELADQRRQLNAQADRLQRIVDFYRFADITQEQNVLSRDSKAITACRQGLEALDVWDKDDWWFRLPVDDLSPAQADQLRWDVYQQWMLLNAMLVKTVGTRLTGSGRVTSASNLLPAIGRFLRTNAGKREAEAAIVASDRVERFRLSEAVRWYRGAAAFRLFKGSRLAGSELGLTRNAADSHSLGVLSMIAALDANFEMFFRDYQGEDSLTAARDLFARASAERPDHYWTSLALAQIEFLLAEREGDDGWRKYDPAIQAVSRCIALEPAKCFAYADRSSIYRAKARAIADTPSLPAGDRTGRAAELRRWSLADAMTANRLGTDQPWVGWQHGLAMHEMGQTAAARERFMEASKLTLELVDLEDKTLVRAEDLRGRGDAAVLAEQDVATRPEDASALTLLASIRLTQREWNAAEEAITHAVTLSDASAHAFAIGGMVQLYREDFLSAREDFVVATSKDPLHPWAHYGLGRCCEADEATQEALAAYRTAQSNARTDEHRAAALLGQARSLAILGRYAKAEQAVAAARKLEPACDLMNLILPVGRHYGQWQKRTPDDPGLPAMKAFLESIATLPRVTNLTIPSATTGPYRAAVLGGGFESGSLSYWDGLTEGNVSRSESYAGERSLTIDAVSNDSHVASFAQEFPVERDSRYRVSLWAKSDSALGTSVKVSVDGRRVIDSPAAAGDWIRLEGAFTSDAGAAYPVIESTIELSAEGQGQIWIDEVQVMWLGKAEDED